MNRYTECKNDTIDTDGKNSISTAALFKLVACIN